MSLNGHLGCFLNKKNKLFLALASALILLTQCTVYRSPERSNFEDEYSKLKENPPNQITVSNVDYFFSSCFDHTQAQGLSEPIPQATNDRRSLEVRLGYINQDQVVELSYLNSTNPQGVYCVYKTYPNS